MKFQSKRLIGIITAVFVILSVPLVAMQFTTEIDWKSGDFIILGILLLGTGLLCELVLRKIQKPQHRVLLCGLLVLALFLVWAELAVGVFGSPFAGS